MTVRLIEWQVPYTWGTAIEITADKVINLLLRAENNLLHVNDDNELYCDLQLENGIAVDDDLPVWVTTWIVNESDGRPQNGLLLHYETTSWAYAQRLYGGDWKLYFNWWTGERKLVYYAEDVDQLLQELHDELVEQLTMHAGEGIEILNGIDYSAMRGPCPDGFHIPTKEEAQLLINQIIILDPNNLDIKTYLKMPAIGSRDYLNASTSQIGIDWYYWTSEPSDSEITHHHWPWAYSISFASSWWPSLKTYSRSYGFGIRAFKDNVVIPNNQWSMLLDGSSIAQGAWIFHDTINWLISISSDGVNWLTISDKNLWATTVWNTWDTVDQAHAWYYYQWWNNYWFAWPNEATPAVSSTLVDTTWYWPWNYYSSNEYIWSNADWSDPSNDNLWGGVTWTVELHNVITNIWVLSVNWRKWHVIVADNVKIFKLEDNQDFDTAQEIFDWFDQWKYPIIYYDNNSYVFKDALQWALSFICSVPELWEDVYHDNSNLKYKAIELFYTGSSVTNISFYSWVPSINYLDTNVNYSSPYIPQYNGSPATKKYVDDRDVHVGTTAPTENLVEGRLWYDTTNDVLKSYDGTNWNIVWDDTVIINTKTFRFTWVTQDDLVTAQAAYEWFKAWKNPIIRSANNKVCLYFDTKSFAWYKLVQFMNINVYDQQLASGTNLRQDVVALKVDDNTDSVTQILIQAYGTTWLLQEGKDYSTPYMPEYDGSPATKKYVDNNDTIKLFTLTDRNDLTTAQAAYDWFLSWKLPVLKESGNYYYCYLYSNGWLQFTQTQFDGTIMNNEESHISKLIITLQWDGTTVSSINHSTFLWFDYLDTNIDYSSPFIPQYNGSPATKIYVDQSSPCVPVYHLWGGDVITSYINFDIAWWTYKVKIQWYHWTTVNRTITVTASSALAGTFISNLIEHYNYWCIVTIDPSVSTTMTIQIDSHSNFTVDDIYIEKINIQSWIVTATAIQ